MINSSPVSSTVIVLTCYVYYYCILLCFNMFFTYIFFSGFLQFSPKGSVTGCDSWFGSICYSPVYFLSSMNLHSGYYYYRYVIIGVLRPLWLNRNSQLKLNNKNNNDNLINKC